MALLVHLVRKHFRTAEPAVIEVDGLRLRLDTGDLYLDGDDPRTPSADGDDRALTTSLRDLARALAGRTARELDAGSAPADEAGPFLAAALAAELARIGARPDAVAKRLGGNGSYVQAAVPPVPIGNAVPPEALPLIDRLAQPTAIGELIDSAVTAGGDHLAHLAVLHALGVVRRVKAPAEAAPVRSDTLSLRLADRVAERLAGASTIPPPDAQREAIATLWQRLGELDHYGFLDVPRTADAAAVTAAFDRVAELVHADNAQRLGLERGDAMLATLFDRAVEAYSTLIDPDRRIAYNRTLGDLPATEVDADQRQREKETIAEEHVQRALLHLGEQDVSIAVDLLKEAVRLDPSPETLALLAKSMARNPRWRRHAVQAWREAIALRPEWAEAYAALAEVLEKMERTAEAIDAYRKVLELAPTDGAAQAALGRLGASVEPEKKRRWGRRSS